MATHVLTPENLFNEDNFVGRLRAVSPAMFEFGMDPGGAFCSVDDYVVIKAGDVAVFGKVTSLESEQAAPASASQPGFDIITIGLVTPSASIDTNTGSILTGVVRTPEIDGAIFKASPEAVGLVLNPLDSAEQSEKNVILNFASFTNVDAGNLSVTPEMMFGRHCSVLGTTGSGKSWSLASMIEECKRHRCKIVLFDPSGEYASLSDGVRSVYLGEDLMPPAGALEVALPYYDLKESDLFAIFRPTGETQAPKLHAAMKTLKLARLEPGIGVDGLMFKANKSKQHYEAAYKRHYDHVENPFCDFDISKLTRQINNECVFPTRSDLEPFIWGDYNGMEQARVIPLVNRIAQVISSRELECIFKPENRPSLLGEIESFLNDPESRVLRISLQHLSFAYNTREIVANAVGRYLLEHARDGRFQRQPLIVFVDEGHHFLNEALTEKEVDYPLDAFALIAKEGRKYCLTICLATQRPRDIPEGVLSQMGSFIVHRIINDSDRSVIERAASQADEATMSVLPMLAPGEAVMLGIEFAIPLHIRVKAPRDKPMSTGPEYQQHWG